MPASVSSWTRAAYEDLDAADEPATQQDEDAELLIEKEEDPSGWSVSQSSSGRPYYWHRSSRRSVWHLPPAASARKKKGRRKRKKRKKRRKRRLPRTSSFSSPRRRLRQWHMQGWFCWFLSYAVSPSFGGRPKLPSFMDGMDKMDSFIARRRSRQWQAGLAGFVPRAVSLSLSSGPRCPASWPVWIRSTVMSVLVLFAGECAPRAVFLSLSSGPRCAASWPLWIRSTVTSVLRRFAGDNAPRAVFSSLVHKPMMLCIMAGMLQNDSCLRRTGKLDYFGDGGYFSSALCIWKSLVRAFA